MGKRKKSKKISRKYIVMAVIAVILVLICIGAGVSNLDEAANVVADTVASLGNSIYGTLKESSNGASNETKEIKTVDGKLEMHTIDVGQGDSSLIIQGKHTLLIDCGTKSKGKTVVKYLKDLGIKRIDVLIGTHPHDDHMGGMAEIINNFEIGTLYTPDNSNDNITTTWYMEFLDAVEQNNVTWVYPEVRKNSKNRRSKSTNNSTKFQ